MELGSRSPIRSAFSLAAPYLAMSALIGVVLAIALRRAGGHFSYSLDDPYIHLALSEQLRRGHYGIDRSEFSSPSSSILWPFLLTATAGSSLHEYTPFVLNWLCALGVIWALRRFLVVLGLSGGRDLLGMAGPVLVAVMLNGVGLVFVGMEHSLQILLALCTVLGLVELGLGGARPLPWWFVASLVLNPWVRYEGLALTGLACVVLALRGHVRAALVAGGLSALGVGLFSAFLVGKGLPPLPSSVLVKASFTADPIAHVRVLIGDMRQLARQFATLWIVIGFALTGWLASARVVKEISLFAAALAAAHLLGGQYMWFGRYCVYIFACATVATLVAAREPIARFIAAKGQPAALAVAALLMYPVCSAYLRTTFHTPKACADIFTQQHQMYRFAAKFHRGPVALMDIGRVAFDNDQYVFDLWGLASDEARVARKTSGNDPTWMERGVRRHGISVAILYEGYLSAYPPSWQRIAVLRNPEHHMTSACDAVSFVLTDPTARERVLAELADFAASGLPQGASLEILEPEQERSLAYVHACTDQRSVPLAGPATVSLTRR